MTHRVSLWALLALSAFLFAGCATTPPVIPTPPLPPAPPPPGLISAPVQPNPVLPSPRPNGSCAVRGALQDSNCTPGVISPLVTQANIKQTICVSGYTAMIRQQFAPVDYTNKLKAQQIAEYGYADSIPADYEEDHLISLELGGHPNDPRNLWPEFPHSPNPKDSVENKLKKLICSGKVDLADAQLAIATNWQSALQSVHIKP